MQKHNVLNNRSRS